MKGYSELEMFTFSERQLLERATALVAKVADEVMDGDLIRCHELARAVGDVLQLPVVDGKFGSVEHSWLLTCKLPDAPTSGFVRRPSILDVYSVGRLPMVQLVCTSCWGLTPHRCYVDVPLVVRDDINMCIVGKLLQQMRG